MLFGITRAASRMGVGMDYVEGIAAHMTTPKRAKGQDAWQQDRERQGRPRKLAELDPNELENVRIALAKQSRRGMTIAEPASVTSRPSDPF